jgi:hypothetical protein
MVWSGKVVFALLLQWRGEETHVMATVSGFWFVIVSVTIFFDLCFSQPVFELPPSSAQRRSPIRTQREKLNLYVSRRCQVCLAAYHSIPIHKPIRLSLSAESVIHSTVFFSHNKSTNQYFLS